MNRLTHAISGLLVLLLCGHAVAHDDFLEAAADFFFRANARTHDVFRSSRCTGYR